MLDLSPRRPLHFLLSSSLPRSNFRFIVIVLFSLSFFTFSSRVSPLYTIPTAALQIYTIFSSSSQSQHSIVIIPFR